MAPVRALRAVVARRLAGALLLLAAAPAQALDLRVDIAGLTPRESAAAQALIHDAVARLPAAWRDAASAPVSVQWSDALPADVHGRALQRRVLLARHLLAGGDARPGSDSPATTALVHELAHLLDREPRFAFSHVARLLDLAGWQRTAPTGLRARRTAFTDRTPDAYEQANPREFVAVNLERFVLDPQYRCRRPSLYRHFAARLGERPGTPCAPGHAFVQADTRADAAGPALESLDPSRVVAVDYLFAAPAAPAMSRWGHAMLRLVVCAPGRAPGPDCRLDLEHHRVLSFRAFVDDVQVSSWRGLTGRYPARLFVLPLPQVVEEYTRIELRDLQSFPLQLDRAEIDALVERAAEVHWSYDGRYRFVTNNCAVETHRLLRDAVPRIGAMQFASLTPTGLLARLRRGGIADGGALADVEAARRGGYLFESLAPHYQSVFDTARASLGLPAHRVEDWLALPPVGRAPWIARADLRAAAALLLLEGAALRREEQFARSELKRRFASAGTQRGPSGALDEARESLRLLDRLTRPAALLSTGYGLPQQAEREALATEATALATRWRRDSTRLAADARAALTPARRGALLATEANVARLGERLRQLHRDSGGLDLAPASTPAPAALP